MRKVIAVGILASLLPTLALARGNHPMAGCGLGYLLLSNQDNDKVKQILMATTNGTFGSQTFGISSGTSGCTNDGKSFGEYKTTLFAEINFEDLSQEMAQGRGEHLASLATLMGIPAEHHAEFFALTQEKYTTLIQSGENAPAAMLKALNAAMADRPILVQVSSTNR